MINIHVLNRWTGWLWCEFDQTQMTYRTKKQKTVKTYQAHPEHKTKTSFVLPHLCTVHKVLTGIWSDKYLDKLSIHFVRKSVTVSLGIYKTTPLVNHVSTSSCILRTEILITFNITCMWTFYTNSLLHEFSSMYTNNYKHFHKWFGIF